VGGTGARVGVTGARVGGTGARVGNLVGGNATGTATATVSGSTLAPAFSTT